MSYIEAINEKHKAIKKFEDEIWRECEHLTTENGEALVSMPYKKLLGWLERRAAITREYEEKAWRSKADDLSRDLDTANGALEIAVKNETKLETRIAELQAELEKRDKGIARLKRQRDEAREALAKYEDCDECQKQLDKMLDAAIEERDELKSLAKSYEENYVNPLRKAGFTAHAKSIARMVEMMTEKNERLEAERDALARDLADCNRQREDLRDRLGIAIDYAHDVIELVNLDA